MEAGASNLFINGATRHVNLSVDGSVGSLYKASKFYGSVSESSVENS